MPRKARVSTPGALYHVMSRCLDHHDMFHDDSDRELFLHLLEKYLLSTNTRCYAWTLMRNHYHLVLHTSECELWQTMKPLNMRYAQYHGKKHTRRGPLFMDRYKSIVTEDQEYVLELIRYVHLNPLRGGICKNLAALGNYQWCGHGVLLGKQERSFQHTKAVLQRFGENTREARMAYVDYLREGIERVDEDDHIIRLIRESNKGSKKGRVPSCWVIGDHEFQKRVISAAQARRLRMSEFKKSGCSFSPIAAKICSCFDITVDRLKCRQRKHPGASARKAFAWVASRHFGAPIKDIASYMNVTSGAVSAMMERGREIAREYKLVK